MTGVKVGYEGERSDVTCGNIVLLNDEANRKKFEAHCNKLPSKPRCVRVPMRICQNIFVPVNKKGKKLKPRFIDVR